MGGGIMQLRVLLGARGTILNEPFRAIVIFS